PLPRGTRTTLVVQGVKRFALSTFDPAHIHFLSLISIQKPYLYFPYLSNPKLAPDYLPYYLIFQVEQGNQVG
ncbi:MAG: hypothetical protein ACOC2U_03000, partial [bacterium]